MLHKNMNEILCTCSQLKKEKELLNILSILHNLKLQINSLFQLCYAHRSSFSKKLPKALIRNVESYLLANDQISMKEVCHNWSLWSFKPNSFSILAFPEHITFENDFCDKEKQVILPTSIYITQNGNLLLFNRFENYIDITSQITQNIDNVILVNRWYFNPKQINLFKFIGTKSEQNNFECIAYFLTDEVQLELIEMKLLTPIQQCKAYKCHSFIAKEHEFCIDRYLTLCFMQKRFLTGCRRKFVLRNENPAIVAGNYNINFYKSRTFYKTHFLSESESESESPSKISPVIQELFYKPAFEIIYSLKSTDKYLIGTGSVKNMKMLVIWSKETYQIQKVRPLALGSLWDFIHYENNWTVNDYLLFVYDFNEYKIKIYDLFENKRVKIAKHLKFKEKQNSKNNVRGMVATNEFLFILCDKLHRFRLNYF